MLLAEVVVGGGQTPTDPEVPEITYTGTVKISDEVRGEYELNSNFTATATYSITPPAPKSHLVWSMENTASSVATVDNTTGAVKCVGIGNATLKVDLYTGDVGDKDKKLLATDRKKFKVTDINYTGIVEILKVPKPLIVGQKSDIIATVVIEPETDNYYVNWSLDNNVFEVRGNQQNTAYLTAKALGQAALKVELKIGNKVLDTASASVMSSRPNYTGTISIATDLSNLKNGTITTLSSTTSSTPVTEFLTVEYSIENTSSSGIAMIQNTNQLVARGRGTGTLRAELYFDLPSYGEKELLAYVDKPFAIN